MPEQSDPCHECGKPSTHWYLPPGMNMRYLGVRACNEHGYDSWRRSAGLPPRLTIVSKEKKPDA